MLKKILLSSLLLFVITGCGNKDRMLCTYTNNSDSVDTSVEIELIFDEGVNTMMNNKYVLVYKNGLTDDAYNKLKEPIDNSIEGMTEYGWDTKISRNDNIVTITSYYPRFGNETYTEVKKTLEEQGYSCK